MNKFCLLFLVALIIPHAMADTTNGLNFHVVSDVRGKALNESFDEGSYESYRAATVMTKRLDDASLGKKDVYVSYSNGTQAHFVDIELNLGHSLSRSKYKFRFAREEEPEHLSATLLRIRDNDNDEVVKKKIKLAKKIVGAIQLLGHHDLYLDRDKVSETDLILVDGKTKEIALSLNLSRANSAEIESASKKIDEILARDRQYGIQKWTEEKAKRDRELVVDVARTNLQQAISSFNAFSRLIQSGSQGISLPRGTVEVLEEARTANPKEVESIDWEFFDQHKGPNGQAG